MKVHAAIVSLALACAATQAHASTYAIAVGNNAPPVLGGGGLPVLSFADDDAVRYHQFFARLADEAVLLSDPDEQTERRYPGMAEVARPPTLAALRETVRRLASRVRDDLARGEQPVVFLAYSGHGGQLEDGTAFLAMADGALTRDVFQREVLAPLSGALVHVFVDACHAEGVVGTRGLFDEELNARAVAVTSVDEAGLSEARSKQFARVGTVLATTVGQESHEWSQIQSGVFTHELLSGLAGAADVNGDGSVEYGEIQAFLAAANRDVKDPRAQPRVVAHPPAVAPRQPIVTLRALRGVAFLEGDFSSLGHFHLERDNGERFAEANLDSEVRGRIAFPANEQIFVQTRDREALISAAPGEVRSVGALRFRRREVAVRGSVEASLRDWLFTSPYGPTYHRGFLDGLSMSPPPSIAIQATMGSRRKQAAVGALSIAAVSLAASVTTTLLAIQANGDAESTQPPQSAAGARARCASLRTVAVISGATAAAAGVAGWWLWPKGNQTTRVVAAPARKGSGVHIEIWGSW